MKREEAEALIEAFDECDDPSIEFTEAQFSQILALARLGLRVKWPSEEDINLVARAINGASPTYQQCARAALSALTEQQ